MAGYASWHSYTQIRDVVVEKFHDTEGTRRKTMARTCIACGGPIYNTDVHADKDASNFSHVSAECIKILAQRVKTLGERVGKLEPPPAKKKH